MMRAADRNWNAGVLTALLLLGLQAGCGEKVAPGTADVKRPAVTGVTVTAVEPSRVSDVYETSGTVKARVSSVIASRVMGQVTAVHVRAGDRVTPGQLLATLDDRDAAQKVRAAEQAHEAAKQGRAMADLTWQRYRRLHDEKALARQEIDQIETQKKVADAQYEQARAGLEEARVWHGFTRITAPAAGVVTERRVDPGSMAVPGMPLFTVESDGGFQLEAALDEALSGKIRVGTNASVTIETLGLDTTGTVIEVVPAVDPATRTFVVKIALADRRLKSGLFAKVRLPRGEREAILVPRGAVVERGQLTGVFAVDPRGIVTYRMVRTGKTHEGAIEVLSGLQAGDRIVTAGLEKAVDGGQIAGGAAP
ncbi:MAG: Multidrug resistance protein MdtA precursor [Syntrophaceae bacterium PtaB.Bin038]|nr:MAG: Multidrug resistance protein MdtA precursor [Syntrophaceae bacterium PtaB.Bin038]